MSYLYDGNLFTEGSHRWENAVHFVGKTTRLLSASVCSTDDVNTPLTYHKSSFLYQRHMPLFFRSFQSQYLRLSSRYLENIPNACQVRLQKEVSYLIRLLIEEK